jgi:alkylated DNA nucleotide flippase Atl1
MISQHSTVLTEFREIQKGAVVEYNDLINATNLGRQKRQISSIVF